MPPVFRFAPSPNGYLHLGHAYSALLNFDSARRSGGRFLLRIEDIDTIRCLPEFEAAIYQDLGWLGITWEQPVRRQSEHLAAYRDAVEKRSDFPNALLNLGHALRDSGKEEEARQAWSQAVTVDPELAAKYFN